MSQAINNMAVTWSDGSLQTGIKLNVTDTSSSASSLLTDLQVGGASRFSVSKAGLVIAPGIQNNATSGSANFALYNDGLDIRSSSLIRWSSSATIASLDLVLARDAANTLAQRNGTNAQAFRIYNTYTDASNYERAKIAWSSNVLQIGTEKLGTGTARALEFQTDGVTRLTITTGGLLKTSSALEIDTGSSVYWNNRAVISSPADAIVRLSNQAGSDFNRLQFGGTTSSFPALKRDAVRLQARLADDSAFTNIQGKLTADANAVAETPTATHTITIYDAAGTGYKVLCVAA